jgi:hypothetical protein
VVKNLNIAKSNQYARNTFHKNGFTGQDCVIAVIDTAAADIPQLNGKLTFCDEYHCDELNTNDHATFILSQLSDWAPDADLLSYCVFPNGQGNTKLVNVALEDIIARAKANPSKQYFVNMSFASNFGKNVMTPTYTRMHELIIECNANRIQVCVAAGNDGGEQLYIYPSRFEEPVCVAAAFGNGAQAWFSVSHDEIDFLDFGVEVQGYDRNGHAAWMSGTSMACPNVVGKSVLLACKMRSDNGVWPSEMELYNELKECAIDCETVGYDAKSGFGFVNILDCDGAYKSADKVEVPEKAIEALKIAKQLIKNFLYKVGNLVKLEVVEVPYSRVVKVGVTPGDDVKAVKDKLLELGYLKTAIKPTFGWESATAVKKFQQDHGLVVDGKVGPITWNALFNVVAPPVGGGQPDVIPGGVFDMSLIPANISRAHAAKIAADLANVSEIRQKLVLRALEFAYDRDLNGEYPLSFYIRGGNSFNKDLLPNVITKLKLDSYLRNANYAPYYDGGRDDMMREASIASGYQNWGFDCSGLPVGLLRFFLLVSSGFDANANTLFSKYCTPTSNPRPADMLWKDGHAGLYLGGGLGIESVGGAYGCQVVPVATRRIWNFVSCQYNKMSDWSQFGKWKCLND